jgi:hypothetical protein
MAAKTKLKVRVLSGQRGDGQEKQPRVPVETTNESPIIRQESDKQSTRRSINMAEQTKAKEAGVDFTGVAKVWKESYLNGLEAGLRWQSENEHAAKSIIKQGLLRSQEWRDFSKDCLDRSLEQIQEHQNENPFVALSRQFIQASHAVTEPLFKTGTEAYKTAVDTYETALAGPTRKSVLEINKKVLDTIIPN